MEKSKNKNQSNVKHKNSKSLFFEKINKIFKPLQTNEEKTHKEKKITISYMGKRLSSEILWTLGV